jgi:hypothetical protein
MSNDDIKAAGRIGMQDAIDWVEDVLQDMRQSLTNPRTPHVGAMVKALEVATGPEWLEALGESVTPAERLGYITQWKAFLELELSEIRRLEAQHGQG